MADYHLHTNEVQGQPVGYKCDRFLAPGRRQASQVNQSSVFHLQSRCGLRTRLQIGSSNYEEGGWLGRWVCNGRCSPPLLSQHGTCTVPAPATPHLPRTHRGRQACLLCFSDLTLPPGAWPCSSVPSVLPLWVALMKLQCILAMCPPPDRFLIPPVGLSSFLFWKRHSLLPGQARCCVDCKSQLFCPHKEM